MNIDKSVENPELVSKTRIKKAMLDFQELGEKLLSLNNSALNRLNKRCDNVLPEDVLNAIRQGQQLKAGGTRHRQIQFIGKLLRSVDTDRIQRDLDEIDNPRLRPQLEDNTEIFCRRLLDEVEGNSAFNDFMKRAPTTNRQQLSQLIRRYQQQTEPTKQKKLYQKLYSFIKKYSF
ncbi:MAG: ribosome-associated protein [Cellvibrionaceae bacterium]|jgi:ribosome-associated protein